MGKQPELDASNDAPENEGGAAQQDVEVVVQLDLSLPSNDVPYEDHSDASPIAMCQICMDYYGSNEVVRNVCGPQCLAEVCSDCLIQHLTATVYSFYAGVLPKMRCPVCLVLLNKTQWTKYVAPGAVVEEEEQAREETSDVGGDDAQETAESAPVEEEDASAEEVEVQEDAPAEDEDDWALDHSHVLAKYEMLCHQSCSFQAPCCHNTEYSMLSRVDAAQVHAYVQLQVLSSQAALVPRLSELIRDYTFHRVDASELYTFLTDSFDAHAEGILESILVNMADDERRASLLLLHLFHHPNTYTTCCNHAVCFKCKAAEHHDGQCNDFMVDENVLDCPGCRVTLVKVDGCDSVTCLCGYTIEWPLEMEKQRLQRKQLVPSDKREYANWHRWAWQLDPCLNEIERVAAELRDRRLQRMMVQHRESLQVVVDRAVRRARLNIWIREQRRPLLALLRHHLTRRKTREAAMTEPTVVTGFRLAPAA